MTVRLTGLVLAVLAVLLAAAAPASAHHVDVSATVSCTGIVSFTATAWPGTSEADRTNAQIRVSYSINGRDFVALPAKRAYAFSAADHYTFSDSFPLGRPLPHSIVVAAQPAGPWSDSAEAGAPRTTGPLVIRSCPVPRATSANVPVPAHGSTPASSPVSVPASSPVSTGLNVVGPTARPGAEASSGPHASSGLATVGGALCAILLGAGVWALLRVRRA